MATPKFTQPVVGRRTFIGGTLAASALAALAGCGGGKGGSSAGGGDNVLSFYLSEPAYIDPYNAQENQGTAVVRACFDGRYDLGLGHQQTRSPCAPPRPPRSPMTPSPTPSSSARA